MQINVMSKDQTIYIFISDWGAFVIVGDRGLDSPKPRGGGGGGGGTVSHKMFQFLAGSPKRYFIHFDTFYMII
jgi:hypothetical protein